MNGAIGQFLGPSAGDDDRKLMAGIFKDPFNTASGWRTFLGKHIPGYNVDNLLATPAGSWTPQHFQALYIMCWAYHPVEKGSYMLRLDSGAVEKNVQGAFDGLLASKKLQSRASSHLSKKGASAHQGWGFLKGYDELLIQVEGQSGSMSVFLKSEGHAMDGAVSTALHVVSWAVKSATGSGKTASAELHKFAANKKYSLVVEARAAENYGKGYEKMLHQLGFSGTLVTVAAALDKLLAKAGVTPGVPATISSDSRALGNAMQGPTGYIKVLEGKKAALKKSGVDFNDEVSKDLTSIAARLLSTTESHPSQIFNEVRVTSAQLFQAMSNFETCAV